eukprot:TRINITY_DN5120_c0_g3_i1.p1 TRINITY_DN5120_c0_g3~~TRINITY_DN5120_c0_g3_i1.p1  ORF type:complete len:1220 (+),score=321.03 TRINITY_DN5120_c0_g3_i1:127-3786(+)
MLRSLVGSEMCIRDSTLLNSIALVILGMSQPTTYDAKHDPKSTGDVVLWWFFMVNSALLAFEIGVRAYQLGPAGFLKVPLNWLDPFVLCGCVGVLASPEVFPGGVALLRVFRLLEMATVVFKLRGPRVVAQSMVYSPMVMGQLCLYLGFWTFVFALMGLEFYHGSLSRRCVDTVSELRVIPETWCGSTGWEWGGSARCQAQYSHECRHWGDLYHNEAGFDNIFQASLVVFSITSMSDWYLYVKALSEAEYTVSIVYPIVVIVILSFITINLFLAAVVFGFSRVSAIAQAEREREREEEEGDANVAPPMASAVVYPEDWVDSKQAVLALTGKVVPDTLTKNPLANSSGPLGADEAPTNLAARLTSSQSERLGATFDSLRGDGGHVSANQLSHGMVALGFDASVSSEESVDRLLSKASKSRQDSLARDEFVAILAGPMLAHVAHPPAPMPFRGRVAAVLGSDRFEICVIAVILLNCILLATYHAGMSDAHKHIFFWGEVGFTSLYGIEAIVKLVFWGPKEYWEHGWNRFDLVVVLLSVLDLVFEKAQISQVRVLRLVRSIRLFRSFKQMSDRSQIMYAMWENVQVILWVFAMLIFITGVYGLAGYQLWASKFDHLFSIQPRANFDTILSSILCMTQGITADDWEPIMYNAMQDADTGWAAAPMFVTVYVICNFLVINLFVASVLNSVITHIQPDEELDMGAEDLGSCWTSDKPLWLLGPGSRVRSWAQQLGDSREYETFMAVVILLSNLVLVFDTGKPEQGLYQHSGFRSGEYISSLVLLGVFSFDLLLRAAAHGLVFGPTRLAFVKPPYLRQSVFTKLVFAALVMEYIQLFTEVVFPDADLLRVGRVARPLRLFNYAPNGVQRVIKAFVESLPLLLTTVLIANAVWFCFAVAGTLQFAGLLAWCNDINVSNRDECVGTFVFSNTGFGVSVSDIPEPRAWTTWWRNFDNIAETYLTLFEVAALDTWGEVMYACMDVTSVDQQPIRNYTPESAVFFVVFMVFGAFFILQLFVTVVVDSYARMQSTEQGLVNELQHQYDSVERLLEFNLPPPLPKRPKGKSLCGIRPFFYDLCIPWDKVDPQGSGGKCGKLMWFLRSHFDNIVMVLVVLNLLVMATRHVGMSSDWELFLVSCNRVFSGLFGVELVIKLLAYSPKTYLKDPWNAVDAVVVVACVATAPVEGSSIANAPNVLRSLRLLKEFRTFRMLTTQPVSYTHLTLPTKRIV